MGYDRNKVIKVAENEIGYLEKSKAAYQKNPDILDQKTAGAGYDNYTKYGRDMHRLYPSVMDFPAAWCDAYCDWCFYKAYGVSTAKSLLGGNFDDYTVSSAQMYKNHGALDKIPEVGAQIFFTRNGAVSGCYHTGLVIAVSSDKKTVTTIEGNTSAIGTGIVANGGCVAKKTRAVNANTLFGHPNYQDGYGTSKKSTAEIVQEVIDGKWGSGTDRKNRLTAAGYNYQTIQNEVNNKLKSNQKSIDEVAQEVIAGKWGHGAIREVLLKQAGYDYSTVQNRVNTIINVANKKSINSVAKEVIEGKWGSGVTRKEKLEAAGYNYSEVQKEVNKLLEG